MATTRTRLMPAFIASELLEKSRYRGKLTFDAFEFRYRHSRWEVMYEERCGPFSMRQRSRSGFGWFVKGRQRIGALAFRIHDPDHCTPKELFNLLDDQSAMEAKLAYALNACWPEFAIEVCSFGDLLYLDALWFDPQHRNLPLNRETWTAILEAIGAPYAIVALNAAPDGHQIVEPDAKRIRDGRTYQLALRRLYRRWFGVTEFPGRFGREGWMWGACPSLESDIPPPKVRGAASRRR